MQVDGFIWLHKLASWHAEQLIFHDDYTGIVRDFVQQAVSVVSRGLTLFDGAEMPGKLVNGDRAKRRASAMAEAENIRYGHKGADKEREYERACKTPHPDPQPHVS